MTGVESGERSFERSRQLQDRLHELVPGGAHTYARAAHGAIDVDLTVAAVRDALPIYRQAIEAGSVDGLLHGRPVAPAIRRTAAPRAVQLDPRLADPECDQVTRRRASPGGSR
ncbi:MAG: glutamate-semialdehyde -aminomutase [Mycobacterium sp.]|jgi:hypothetical protein|nr:glutamate-semialdehyde -aminomutase [Mycobacterium sp.]